MSTNYRIGAAWIFSADNITDPLSSWTKLAQTRDGVNVVTKDGFLSTAKVDQIGMTGLASSVRKIASEIEKIDTKFINFEIDEIIKAIPGGVKVSDSTNHAVGFGNINSTISPKVFAVVPVADYNEETPGSWYSSDNVWFIESAYMEITGEINFKLSEGDDSLEGYSVSIIPFAIVGSSYMGGRALYRLLKYKEVTVGDEPANACFTNDSSKIYVPNVNSNNVSVIDTNTMTVTSTITVGSKPIHVVFNSDSSKAYVLNFNSASVTVIDTSNDTVIKTISGVGTAPRWGVIDSNDDFLYLSLQTSNQVATVNLSDDTVTSVAVGTSPRKMDISPDDTKVYICDFSSNRISILNTSTGVIDGTISLSSSPTGVSFDVAGVKAYVSMSNGYIATITVSTGIVDGSEQVSTTLNNIILSTISGVCYVCDDTNENSKIIKYDLTGSSIIDSFNVGTNPYGFGYSSSLEILAVSNRDDDTIDLIGGA